ncbi:MAG: alkyl sulfatase dimerization domain-containing protein [Pseudomonadota bacterium]
MKTPCLLAVWRTLLLLSLSGLAIGCGGDVAEAPTPKNAEALDDQTPEPALLAPPEPGVATPATEAANAEARDNSGLFNDQVVANAKRGLIAQIEAPAILNKKGEAIWRVDALDFVNGAAPKTAHPKLWRQSQLAAIHGVFEVVDGIYQVRGYDLAVMSVIRGETGWIVIDPLTSVEAAAAALALVNDALGERPVSALIYTHSHADHFGGAEGVLPEDPDARARIPIIAPDGFTREAVTENLLAGPHMGRRAVLMFGRTLAPGPAGRIGVGLGPGLSSGSISLVPPTEEISGDNVERAIDGVRFEFMDAAGTEAPAEFMFYLPDFRAFCAAEVVTGTLHNTLTLRGAKARDALRWSKVIDRALVDYGDKSDVIFASHHWPAWGEDAVKERLRAHRDAYRALHDQTLRRANAGGTIHEIPEQSGEPAVAKTHPGARGFYGSYAHNAKAVYQFYFGWWDGVPANFYQHGAVPRAERFVAAMGGRERTLEAGKSAFAQGDYRWAAELFNQLVFAASEDKEAATWLAATYEQLGYQAESGAWRNYFLAAAQELRTGKRGPSELQDASQAFLASVPTADLFDALAVRYRPEKLDRDPFQINFEFTDTNEKVGVIVGADAIIPRFGVPSNEPAATFETTRALFNELVLGRRRAIVLMATGKLKIKGDRGAVTAFFDSLDQPPADFPIASP